ncbi:MAG: hypothetical protein Q7S24_01395, partial [bacterium]|nr:hypothetical protein [bacterium]
LGQAKRKGLKGKEFLPVRVGHRDCLFGYLPIGDFFVKCFLDLIVLDYLFIFICQNLRKRFYWYRIQNRKNQ